MSDKHPMYNDISKLLDDVKNFKIETMTISLVDKSSFSDFSITKIGHGSIEGRTPGREGITIIVPIHSINYISYKRL
jgi:hypothetical protein